MKTIISIIIAITTLAISNNAIAQTNDTLKTATIKVKGIACNGDMPVIKKKLVNQEGIDEVTYSTAKSGSVEFTVKYHSAIITEKRIKTTIEGTPGCDNPDEQPYKVQTINSDPAKK